MYRVRSFWVALRASLWFVPALLVSAAVCAAFALIEADAYLPSGLSAEWPRVFGAGAEGARGMLTAIATSMITVAGTVFSVTIVALSLATSQYSPRVLRNFMSDRPTQVVLGAFVAVFAYCLIVLRTIRGGDEGTFVPSLAVIGGVLMAFIGIGLLIFFVHHVATAIQVTSIVERISSDTLEAIDRLFPRGIGEDLGDETPGLASALPASGWHPVMAGRSGYIVAVDAHRLMDLAARGDAIVHLTRRVGDYVVEGTPIARTAPGNDHPPVDAWRGEILGCFTLRGERNVDQDAAFGFQQLVDITLKALSPSVHDPSTAGTCVDHIGGLLHRLSSRRIEGTLRQRNGRLRLVVERPDYDDFVRLALGAITHHAGTHDGVHARLIASVELASSATDDPSRLQVLASQVDAHLERLSHCDQNREQMRLLRERATTLRDGLWRRARRPASRRTGSPAR